VTCSTPASRPSRSFFVLGLAGWIVLCFLAPALGAFSMPDAWYASLHKPTWNPPGWVFGPVWTLLYIMMVVAALAGLDSDWKYQLAAERAVELIGDAATRLPPELRERHREIPWREMIGMRNRLIHGYDGGDCDIVWDVPHTHAPQLTERLPGIIAAEMPPGNRDWWLIRIGLLLVPIVGR
jgi:uncharacterized protein with HEPN domain